MLAPDDLMLALIRDGTITPTRPVQQANWAVATVISTTQFTVVTVNPQGLVPNVGPSAAGLYQLCELEWVTGILSGVTGTYGRVTSLVQSVTTNTGSAGLQTTVTVADPLPASPNPGDRFIIYARANSLPNVNVVGWNSTTVASPDAAGNVPVTWRAASGAPLGTSSNPVVVSGSTTTTGTVTANQGTAGTQAWPVELASQVGDVVTDIHAVGGTNVPTVNGVPSVPVTIEGTPTVDVGNFPATQAVSGTVTANQGTAGTQAWPVSLSGTATITGTVNQGAAGTAPWPVDPTAAVGTLQDASGTTSATAGTSTQALAAGSVTRYLFIQNVSTQTGQFLWVNFGATATAGAGSIVLGPGGALVYETTVVPTQAVNVASNTASLPYTLKYV